MWRRMCTCQTTSHMCSSPQTWKSLASANVCRGWCICVMPVKCKKGVAPGRCVSPTCANHHLHSPTHFQKCMHFPLRRKECQQRYAHKIVHPCMCNCNARKVCWLRGGVFVDVITFEIELTVLVFLKFALLKIRCHASPYRKPDEGRTTENPGCPNFN